MRSGCPTSIGIVHEQLRRVAPMSLAETFRMELNVANHCARNPDFTEGVRALIIDKDNKPAWRYRHRCRNLPHDYVVATLREPVAATSVGGSGRTMMARIGFVGLGNMGGPMLLNLLKAGHQVTRVRSRRVGAGARKGGRRGGVAASAASTGEGRRVLHQHVAGEPPRRRAVPDARRRRQNAARSNFEVRPS